MNENELILVEKLNTLELFTGDAMESIIGQIRAIVDQHVPDVSTAAGRKAIGSLAFKVASTKVTLDDLGKNLVANWKEQSKKVDAVRKKMRDDLDALRDYARQPLTAWEQAEAEKLRQEEFDRQWDKAWDDAYSEQALRERERIVREKEAELARQEAERKAKAEAERLERERKEREDRLIREAKESAERDAKLFLASKEMALAKERDRAERAEREKAEAAERAKVEQEAAVRRAEQRVREETDRKERERLAAEQAEKARQEKLVTNKKHRAKIEQEAEDSIVGLGMTSEDAYTIVIAASKGEIAHVVIVY